MHNWNIFAGVQLPVSDLGSLARDPSLLMVLMTKFFSRVKLVRPTDSELSMTKTMSRAPQRFSQSAEQKNVFRTRLGIGGYSHPDVTGLTAAATRFPDVVHHITFLLTDTWTLNHSCFL